MKKKLLLGGVALLVVVGLVAGGTLMLFSDTTDEAHNVVTLGEAKIELWEDGGEIIRDGVPVPGYDQHFDEKVDGNWDGFDWMDANARPGDIIKKAPYIRNTGSVPVYIKATGRFGIIDADENDVALADLAAMFPTLSFDDLYETLYFAGATGTNPNWTPGPYSNDADYYYGVWYYTNGPSGPLAEVQPGVATGVIFDEVRIPLEGFMDALQGYTFYLDIIGYAVQSNGNPYKTAPTDYENAAFPALLNGGY